MPIFKGGITYTFKLFCQIFFLVTAVGGLDTIVSAPVRTAAALFARLVASVIAAATAATLFLSWMN